MKTLNYIFAILILSISFIACSSDEDEDTLVAINPVADLNKIYEISEADHSLEIYSEKTTLEVGYNEISLRIKDKANSEYLTNAEITWKPMMQMASMGHSAPHSTLSNSEENSVYKGHIIFQMASNETEYWELRLNYSVNGQVKEKAIKINVLQPADGLKKVNVFMGSDETKYVLAYVSPKSPKVALNDMQAILYRMENMMSFPLVENYKIAVDPRMPGMGNHSSPNNQDLTFNASTKMYDGKISLTMTGYWVVNLKLANENDEVLKGEDVTESNPMSSLYFELEF